MAHAVVTVLLAVALAWQWHACNETRADLTAKADRIDEAALHRDRDIHDRLKALEIENAFQRAVLSRKKGK